MIQKVSQTDLEESARRDRNLPLDAPFKKQLEDILRYEAIIDEVRPQLVIETGTWHGHSAAWFADLVDHVVTVDKVVHEVDLHPRVTYFTEGSLDDVTLRAIAAIAKSYDRVLVSLDSAHDTAHVLGEIEAYAPFVSIGSYLVVEDTVHHWREPEAFPVGGDPWEALELWQPEAHGFEVATDIEAMSPVTANPWGWLRRVR